MDDPERYSRFDSTPAVNGEFIKTDDYIDMKLRLTQQNKMLREFAESLQLSVDDDVRLELLLEKLDAI